MGSSTKMTAPTPHIAAQVGEIAETILLPGDPLRAKFIADTFLEDVKQFNATRNMFGDRKSTRLNSSHMA